MNYRPAIQLALAIFAFGLTCVTPGGSISRGDFVAAGLHIFTLALESTLIAFCVQAMCLRALLQDLENRDDFR